MKAMGTVSRTDTEVRGMENILAPKGRELAEGASVPHWYRTYVSFTSKFFTTCGRHNAQGLLCVTIERGLGFCSRACGTLMVLPNYVPKPLFP